MKRKRTVCDTETFEYEALLKRVKRWGFPSAVDLPMEVEPVDLRESNGQGIEEEYSSPAVFHVEDMVKEITSHLDSSSVAAFASACCDLLASLAPVCKLLRQKSLEMDEEAPVQDQPPSV